MTLKKVKDLLDVTAFSTLKANNISPDFAIKYDKKGIIITYLEERGVTKNLNSFRDFLKKNKITNLRLSKKGKNILVEEKDRFNPANIEEKSEKASVWIFNRALVDDKVYHNINDIKNDTKFKELEDIFEGNVPDEWLESFYKQQKRLLEEFGRPYWGKFEYDESDNFMEFIKDVLSEVTLDGKKVQYKNWNPSDVWMIKDGSKQKVKEFIRRNISRSSRSQTIHELNALLRILIRRKELIGLSLKKIGRGNAKFIYVNINIQTKDIFDGIEDVKKMKDIVINFGLDNKNEFKDQQAKVVIKEGRSIQIKPQSANRDTNLTFEVLITESGGRGGKAPVNEVLKFLKPNSFENSMSDYPRNNIEFLERKNEYVKMYDKIIQKGVDTDVKNSNEFVENISKAFNSGDQKTSRLATYKLMELKFLSEVMESDNSNEIWTDIFYLGIKKGKTFAPHGKLY
jgi:hypothetical protein